MHVLPTGKAGVKKVDGMSEFRVQHYQFSMGVY